LFLPKETSQIYAYTGNLWTVKKIGNKDDWFRSSGLRGDPGEIHDWIHTTYGLVFHWHVTDVAEDDPREFYRFIDPKVIFIYAFLALASATLSWLVTRVGIHISRKQIPRSTR
jgi:hypothetical protein